MGLPIGAPFAEGTKVVSAGLEVPPRLLLRLRERSCGRAAVAHARVDCVVVVLAGPAVDR